MLMALLIAGIVFLLAGLAGIALGIPVKEFSFGNTEILAGVIVACTGMIMVSLWITIREFKKVARRVNSAVVPPMPRPPFALPSALTDPSPYEGGIEDNGVLPELDEAKAEPERAAPLTPSPLAPSSLPWQQESASRGRRGETPLPEESFPRTRPPASGAICCSHRPGWSASAPRDARPTPRSSMPARPARRRRSRSSWKQ